jgi:hypothetical protein
VQLEDAALKAAALHSHLKRRGGGYVAMRWPPITNHYSLQLEAIS